MFEFCSLLCLKLAIAHAQKRLLCLSEFVILALHYYTRKLFITWNKLKNQFRIYQICKKNEKCLLLTKTSREYCINITFPDWVIVENIISRNVIIKRGAGEVDNHISRDDIFDYHSIRDCDIYFIIPNIRSFIFYRLMPTMVRLVPKGKWCSASYLYAWMKIHLSPNGSFE